MKGKILVIDDETALAELVKMDLEARDYEVALASDGEVGLEKAVAERPALIILDIMMPKLDGYEVLRRLRNDPQTRLIPVIMLSARSEPKSIEASLGLGVTEYLIKPFDSEELLASIQRHLG